MLTILKKGKKNHKQKKKIEIESYKYIKINEKYRRFCL